MMLIVAVAESTVGRRRTDAGGAPRERPRRVSEEPTSTTAAPAAAEPARRDVRLGARRISISRLCGQPGRRRQGSAPGLGQRSSPRSTPARLSVACR